MVQVRFEAYYSGIGEVMRSDEVTGPMRAEAEAIASRANSAALGSGRVLRAQVVEHVREADGRPEAQVQAPVDEADSYEALTILRKVADV